MIVHNGQIIAEIVGLDAGSPVPACGWFVIRVLVGWGAGIYVGED